MCAAFFLSRVPSVPSLKMPASCLVRVFHLPHYCDKQQYKAELLQVYYWFLEYDCFYPINALIIK